VRSWFIGRAIGRTKVAGFEAIVPEVTGSAYVTGYHTYMIDPDDPVGGGFRI
jgi:proline racemase/trans-L-3-hydroxyproline dehydratase